ncbi:MAG: hypothetical protein JXR76_26270 [Deltaproteobacteria bacterium]|nr:hypothetical protein [Deltaproteobacteria bacterium]
MARRHSPFSQFRILNWNIWQMLSKPFFIPPQDCPGEAPNRKSSNPKSKQTLRSKGRSSRPKQNTYIFHWLFKGGLIFFFLLLGTWMVWDDPGARRQMGILLFCFAGAVLAFGILQSKGKIQFSDWQLAGAAAFIVILVILSWKQLGNNSTKIKTETVTDQVETQSGQANSAEEKTDKISKKILGKVFFEGEPFKFKNVHISSGGVTIDSLNKGGIGEFSFMRKTKQKTADFTFENVCYKATKKNVVIPEDNTVTIALSEKDRVPVVHLFCDAQTTSILKYEIDRMLAKEPKAYKSFKYELKVFPNQTVHPTNGPPVLSDLVADKIFGGVNLTCECLTSQLRWNGIQSNPKISHPHRRSRTTSPKNEVIDECINLSAINYPRQVDTGGMGPDSDAVQRAKVECSKRRRGSQQLWKIEFEGKQWECECRDSL